MALIERTRGSVPDSDYFTMVARRAWACTTMRQRAASRRKAFMAPLVRGGLSRSDAYKLVLVVSLIGEDDR